MIKVGPRTTDSSGQSPPRPALTLLIGHRGTGKTALLRRIATYRPHARLIDLDAAIEEREGETVSDLFLDRGEAVFRVLEAETLTDLCATLGDTETYVALGAGFDGTIPSDAECIWVRRPTDTDGRVFLDRPRLDERVDPIAEFFERYPARESRDRARADRILELREGEVEPSAAEASWLTETLSLEGAIATILPDPREDRFIATIRRWLAADLVIEVRDDILTDPQRALALEHIPDARLLCSCRRPGAFVPDVAARIDWDVALGPSPRTSAIHSVHANIGERRVGDFAETLESRSPSDAHLKLALGIERFRDLLDGHRWMTEAPDRRTFVPLSNDGRWTWYRLLRRGAGLDFVREGAGSAPDQPTFLQWAAAIDGPDGFAAVLGDPVHHSRTPVRHQAFFAARRMPVVPVRVAPNEWPEAIDVLHELGLTHAAVTAPLKTSAHDSCNQVTEVAAELGVVNTLVRTPDGWSGHNTDIEGLVEILGPGGTLDAGRPIVVWGGGGMLPLLRSALPDASFYAARTGERREGPAGWPAALVMATSRIVAPIPATWRPSVVIDLDYRENSAGRIQAERLGARYVSGLAMFEVQAAAQQAYWASNG